jgi:hypothetical protein
VPESIRLMPCLAIEIFDQLLNLWDSSGSTNEEDLINFGFIHACIIKNLSNWHKSLLEKITAKFFESSSCDGLTEPILMQLLD